MESLIDYLKGSELEGLVVLYLQIKVYAYIVTYVLAFFWFVVLFYLFFYKMKTKNNKSGFRLFKRDKGGF